VALAWVLAAALHGVHSASVSSDRSLRGVGISGHDILATLEQLASHVPTPFSLGNSSHLAQLVDSSQQRTLNADSSCSTFIEVLAYSAVDERSQAVDLFFNYSSPDLPGKCCSHCDANASCVAWTLLWNQYSHPASARCKTFNELPQPWAVSRATPPFECNVSTASKVPFNATACANFTQSFLSYNPAVSGHKRRRSPEIPTPPPIYPEDSSVPKSTYRNILYLVADDFRPQLASYGCVTNVSCLFLAICRAPCSMIPFMFCFHNG
jgi:hypothetical protein